MSISKIIYDGVRVKIEVDEARGIITEILNNCGCELERAELIADHLVDSNLCGVESHGAMRILQYVDQFRSGYMKPESGPCVSREDEIFLIIDGQAGHGIPAMDLAYKSAAKVARTKHICVTSIINVGHTGRHGSFADHYAEDGFFSILIGGGNREVWRQVAPYGGCEPKLPTNPYCIGFPGDECGPLVLDFATSMIAGGWIYAAQNAGGYLPENCIIDRNGMASVTPADYFDGGSILPAAGQKGYGLALAAELISEALIGPVQTEGNWLLLMINTSAMTPLDGLRKRASVIFDDIISCKPAPGFEKVEIPGQRERRLRHEAGGIIDLPENTWNEIVALRNSLVI